ncbi:MAG: hypothetical protein MK141_08590 [Pseudoxanthomonas sp.]|jgi:hypothetical protein|uniref:hypothetical protein n=1 Tax=Pseudoxanthomonas TaxID=83618 RepID=UPI00138A5C40|nr:MULTISPECIES: hypothetical protein [Pseudoxanthomonas]MCH2091615.1 hypothetical protein [Pseudoxanthomonas sp.]
MIPFINIINGLEPQHIVWALFGAAMTYAHIRFALWATPIVAKFFLGRYIRGKL